MSKLNTLQNPNSRSKFLKDLDVISIAKELKIPVAKVASVIKHSFFCMDSICRDITTRPKGMNLEDAWRIYLPNKVLKDKIRRAKVRGTASRRALIPFYEELLKRKRLRYIDYDKNEITTRQGQRFNYVEVHKT